MQFQAWFLISCFNRLVSDQLQINRFWCRIIFVNNICGIFLLVIGLFCVLNSNSLLASIPISAAMFFFYIFVFLFIIPIAGDFIKQVTRAETKT